jgi:hypothetical protein
MAAVFTNAGELLLVEWMTQNADENYTLKLYKSNTTPTATSVAGDFTIADFTGYSNKTLTAGSWGVPTTVSGSAVSTYATQTWTLSDNTAQTTYGVIAIGATSGTLVWAEKFAIPRSVTLSGDIITYTPKIGGHSEN